jgi:diadenosine tetraphosphate (Ap4A) HIT family hydrolase
VRGWTARRVTGVERSPSGCHTGNVEDCPICVDNAAADRGVDPWFVARLQTGYVRFAPNQYFKGSVFFAAKRCVREVFDLDEGTRGLHLAEMSEVPAAVHQAFRPRKMNLESLGNGVPHLHWWITPRYESDPRPRGPIWEDLNFLQSLWCEGGRPSSETLSALQGSLLAAVRSRDVTIELTQRGEGPDQTR